MEIITFRKDPRIVEDVSPYGPSYHEAVIPDCKISSREDWVQYMFLTYRRLFPRYRESVYRKWAEAKIDQELEKLGDYFSRSSYVPDR